MNFTTKYLEEFELAFSDLYYFREDIKMIFNAEKKIIENSENYSKNLIADLKIKVKKDNNLLLSPKSEQDYMDQAQYYDHYYGETETFIEQLFENQRKAAILSTFSLIEGQLKVLCKLIQNEFNFKIKLNDLNGSDYINRYWIYLTKVFEINPSDLEALYAPIKEKKYIRNKIAHSNSMIEAGKVKFINDIPGLKVISYSDDHKVKITSFTFIESLMQNGEDFFNKLIKVVDTRYKAIKNND